VYLDRRRAGQMVDLLARLVISYFLAPSDHVDLGDRDSAREFIAVHILPTFTGTGRPIASTGAPS
jgi:hypothetical protein